MLFSALTWLLALLALISSGLWLSPRQMQDSKTFWPFTFVIFCLYTQALAFFLPLHDALPLLVFISVFQLRNQGKRQALQGRLQELLPRGAEWLIILILLFASALPSWVNDDYSYYRPSIQILATKGWHSELWQENIRLALASAWHHLNAAVYIPAFGIRACNLNPLFLAFVVIAAWRTKAFTQAYVLLLLGGLLVIAPSPDLPLMVIGFWLLLYFGSEPQPNQLFLASLLPGIKSTAAIHAVFALGKRPIHAVKSWLKWMPIPIIALGLLLARQYVISGHMLFPLSSHPNTEAPFSSKQLQFFSQEVKAEVYGYGFQSSDFPASQSLTYHLNQLIRNQSAYKLLFTLMVLMGMAFFVSAHHRSINAWLFVGITLAFWLFTAPNYRYQLMFVAYLLWQLLAHIAPFKTKKPLLAVLILVLAMQFLAPKLVNIIPLKRYPAEGIETLWLKPISSQPKLP